MAGPAWHYVLKFIITGFQNARTWLADVREHADPNLTCILVGNKVDLCADAAPSSTAPATATSSSLDKTTAPPPGGGSKLLRSREVTYEEAEQWAKEEGLLFVEASAKSGQNVELAFVEASQDILEKIKRGVFDDDRYVDGSVD
ncbi:hypothetical protein EST38_g2049 [Candolleomyces aberdarensis]|uniref:Uncharacterized protein n=1 Tax=Candolleomyces aberdarensis TaxID=2316362 RepID=A0A4Q2DWK5_9AGAR|nr:hypothetical protein EST38_g2049 [Candolleomyces aberdarensis]